MHHSSELASFLPKEKLDELVINTKQVAAKVIELKGATVHAPGNAISAILESVVRDRKQVIPVATYLDGEYTFRCNNWGSSNNW